MAERLDEFEFLGPGGGRKYPWAQWFDGGIWKLSAGTDFTCSVKCFRNQVGSTAKRRRKIVQTQLVDERTLVLQAVANR